MELDLTGTIELSDGFGFGFGDDAPCAMGTVRHSALRAACDPTAVRAHAHTRTDPPRRACMHAYPQRGHSSAATAFGAQALSIGR